MSAIYIGHSDGKVTSSSGGRRRNESNGTMQLLDCLGHGLVSIPSSLEVDSRAEISLDEGDVGKEQQENPCTAHEQLQGKDDPLGAGSVA